MKRTYKCSHCGQTVVTFVTLVDPPACTKHVGGNRVMQPVEPAVVAS
jgi:DNA-directed RNA polymerase subunit RPC12/RpoP